MHRRDAMGELVSAYSDAPAADSMASALCASLAMRRPVGAVLYASVDVDIDEVSSKIRSRVGNVPIIGCTSCLGPAMRTRFAARRKTATVLWMTGEGYRFGTAFADKGPVTADAAGVGRQLVNDAVRAAGMDEADVRFAILHATPGDEEALLAGVQSELPGAALLLGGTAADNDLSGRWRVWNERGSSDRAVVLAVCDWPWKLGMAFRSGYLPSSKTAEVTRVDGRILYELDGRPAAEVYDEWLGGTLAEERRIGGQVLSKTTFAPLGVPRARVAGTDAFVLIHPERVLPHEGALALFATVHQGERVTLMHCTERGLIQRSGRVALDALRDADLHPDRLVGALMIYCGGCVLPLEHAVPDILEELAAVVGGTPSVSTFTFGEQGTVIPRRVEHGNLMASVLLLSNEDEAA